jgi:hypothetical protein
MKITLTTTMALLLVKSCGEFAIETPANCGESATIYGTDSACHDFTIELDRDGSLIQIVNFDYDSYPFTISEGLKVEVSFEEDTDFTPSCLALFKPDTKWYKVTTLCLDDDNQ